MNRFCFLSLAACRTPCHPWDMRFPLCVGRMCDCTMFPSVCALPSPASMVNYNGQVVESSRPPPDHEESPRGWPPGRYQLGFGGVGQSANRGHYRLWCGS